MYVHNGNKILYTPAHITQPVLMGIWWLSRTSNETYRIEKKIKTIPLLILHLHLLDKYRIVYSLLTRFMFFSFSFSFFLAIFYSVFLLSFSLFLYLSLPFSLSISLFVPLRMPCFSFISPTFLTVIFLLLISFVFISLSLSLPSDQSL